VVGYRYSSTVITIDASYGHVVPPSLKELLTNNAPAEITSLRPGKQVVRSGGTDTGVANYQWLERNGLWVTITALGAINTGQLERMVSQVQFP
jgi:hypothetical protein